ncbi:MAG: CPBP family intramembrane metalloprotease [Bacteroidaceae bacterium]|nr:CPBP family intramembrane metalloprotease [Bacteroidaceae bacterium]
MKHLLSSLLVAATLWFLMFSPWTASYFNFWYAMTASALILTALAVSFGGVRWPKLSLSGWLWTVVGGAAIAVVLWGVFWVGDKLSQWMFAFARPQVDLIYGMKDGSRGWLISLLLLFIIGPAEELFWRGYVQQSLVRVWLQRYRRMPKARAARKAKNWAYVLATAAYTLVHLPSGNFMLIMAAMVCGIAWGGLYRLMPKQLPAIVVSHALWDAAAFVWLPL